MNADNLKHDIFYPHIHARRGRKLLSSFSEVDGWSRDIEIKMQRNETINQGEFPYMSFDSLPLFLSFDGIIKLTIARCKVITFKNHLFSFKRCITLPSL